MSPLWRDEVGIFLSPSRVLLNRMRRGLRPMCVADRALSVEGGGYNDWGPSLAVLESQLQDPSWQGANARIVVANHWNRCVIVPWCAELSSDVEREAHGRLLLQEVFGDTVDDWTLTLGETASGRPELVCAMPAALRSDLCDILMLARLRLVSLQPHLVVSYNRWRRHLPEAGGWLVVIDDGALAALRMGRAGWEEVHGVRIGSDWSAELERLRTFARLAGGSPDGSRVLVEAPYWLRRVAAATSESLEWLEPDETASGTLENLARLAELNA